MTLPDEPCTSDCTECSEQGRCLMPEELAAQIVCEGERNTLEIQLSYARAEAEALADALERLLDRREVNETWSETYMARDVLARYRGAKDDPHGIRRPGEY